MNTPNGLNEIIGTFGDIYKYILPDGTVSHDWPNLYITSMDVPFSLPLSWAPTVRVNKISCHTLMVPIFTSVFANIVTEGLQDKIVAYGGCYNFRQQRGASKISTHAWGIAIDLNPTTNEQGTMGDMNPSVIKIFTDAGFYWGGNFIGKRRDSMHFQFCTNY